MDFIAIKSTLSVDDWNLGLKSSDKLWTSYEKQQFGIPEKQHILKTVQ